MEIIVQDNLINSDIYSSLIELEYSTTVLPVSRWKEVLISRGEELSGFVFSELDDDVMNIIRLVRNGRYTHPWLPFVLLGELSDSIFLPIGCAIFEPDNKNEILSFLSKPLSLNILLVEDDNDINHLITKTLSLHYSVDSVTDGHDALMSFQQNKYDLVILDIMLPGLSGDELFKKFRVIHPKQPIIIITSHDDQPEFELDFIIKGANEYLTKPFAPISIIHKTIVKVLSEHNMSSTIFQSESDAQLRAWGQWSASMSEFIDDESV